VLVWLLVVAAAAAALVADLAGVDLARLASDRLTDAEATTVATAYAWALAARTGGRPFLVAALALVLGGVVVVVDDDMLRSGAAVVTAALAAVLAVMVTVPVRGVAGAAREVLVALVIASIGAMATVAWAPSVAVGRFQYTVLAVSFLGAFVMVSRLGSGFQGLGSRGVLLVLAGGVMLVLSLGYAELLRRYGTTTVVDGLDHAVRWSRHHLGAFPRPIVALLGVPALTWGTHLRRRRRQGWWVCAFGVAFTAPVAYALVDPGRSVREVALSTAYGAVIGLGIGALLIWADLRLSAPRAPRGRRLAEVDAATSVRPEPGRTRALW
jgi:hypothetical protein